MVSSGYELGSAQITGKRLWPVSLGLISDGPFIQQVRQGLRAGLEKLKKD